MDTWEAICTRRDVRDYAEAPIDDAVLDRILEAGRRSPSARNWQPWTFVVVSDRERLERLSHVWQGAGHVARSAATVALVAATPQPDQLGRLHFDLGQAAMSMLLAATAAGVASGHSAVEDQELARSILELSPDETCWYLLVFGHPTEPLQPIQQPDRRSFDDVVRRVGPATGG